eukprot:3880641-Rhodomonas_salina.1
MSGTDIAVTAADLCEGTRGHAATHSSEAGTGGMTAYSPTVFPQFRCVYSPSSEARGCGNNRVFP